MGNITVDDLLAAVYKAIITGLRRQTANMNVGRWKMALSSLVAGHLRDLNSTALLRGDCALIQRSRRRLAETG